MEERNYSKNRFNKKLLRPLMVLVVLIVLGIVGWQFIANQGGNTSQTSSTGKNTPKVNTQRVTLNQTFDFTTGLEKQGGIPLKMTFQTAQLTNRVYISKKANFARPGTQYLMLNLLIENGNTKGLVFRSRDTIRLIDSNGKKFAPSLHNKEISVPADAAKKDVVGFLVPDNLKEFKIQYGPLTGTKQIIELKFN
jgi:hypothetical protein